MLQLEGIGSFARYGVIREAVAASNNFCRFSVCRFLYSDFIQHLIKGYAEVKIFCLVRIQRSTDNCLANLQFTGETGIGVVCRCEICITLTRFNNLTGFLQTVSLEISICCFQHRIGHSDGQAADRQAAAAGHGERGTAVNNIQYF